MQLSAQRAAVCTSPIGPSPVGPSLVGPSLVGSNLVGSVPTGSTTVGTIRVGGVRPATRPASPDALDLLEQFGSTMRVARDAAIHAEGDPAEYCYLVLSGCVRTVRLMEDGRRQVGEFLLKDDIFGLEGMDTHDFAAEAVTDTVVRRYPRRMVETLAETRPVLSRHLREVLRASLRAANSRMVLLGRKTATEKIASFLAEMDRRAPAVGGKLLELPMNRTDIADHLGLTVETVCRVLAHLKRDGVIRIARTGIELQDRRALRMAAAD